MNRYYQLNDANKYLTLIGLTNENGMNKERAQIKRWCSSFLYDMYMMKNYHVKESMLVEWCEKHSSISVDDQAIMLQYIKLLNANDICNMVIQYIKRTMREKRKYEQIKNDPILYQQFLERCNECNKRIRKERKERKKLSKK